MTWYCSFGVPECPICKRSRLANEKQKAEDKVRAEARAKMVLANIQTALIAGRVKAMMKNGKMTFTGLSASERDGATDECLFLALKQSGSALARAKLAQAEMVSGTARQTIGQ